MEFDSSESTVTVVKVDKLEGDAEVKNCIFAVPWLHVQLTKAPPFYSRCDLCSLGPHKNVEMGALFYKIG